MTRLRGAAGVCASATLTASIFLGGAGTAVAFADTGADSGGTTSSNSAQGAAGSASGGAESGQTATTTKIVRPGVTIAGDIQDRLQSTVRDFTGALGALGVPRKLPKVTIFPPPRSASTASESGSGSSSEKTTATGSSVASSAPTASATTPSVAAVAESSPVTNDPIPTATAPAVPPPASKLAASVNAAAASARDAADALPALLAGLPTSTTPITDVVTTMQALLTSVGDSVTAIAQIPADLSTMLGIPSTPVTVGDTATTGRTVSATATPPSPIDLLPAILAAGPAVTIPAAAPATPVTVPAFAGSTSVGLSQELVNTSPLAMHGTTSTGSTASTLEKAVSTFLIPLSVAALAALALPGVGGLLVVCGLGMRIGYRQAKANFVLQAAGISRFAGPGPLGVVRSGSFVALHASKHTNKPRTARTGRQGAVAAVVALDRAA